MSQEQLVSIQLNVDSIHTVLRGLDQLPHGQSRGLVDDIIQQAQSQITPAQSQVLDVEPAEERE